MKRYYPYRHAELGVAFEEDTDGDWVRYEDAAAEILRLNTCWNTCDRRADRLDERLAHANADIVSLRYERDCAREQLEEALETISALRALLK